MDRYKITSLKIDGYSGTVPNQLWSIHSTTLMVLLPGYGYTNQMPIMFYLNGLARGRSWDVLEVNYDYRSVDSSLTMEKLAVRFLADVKASITTATSARSYEHVVIAGKSIGAMAMSLLHEQTDIAADAWIWLTPAVRHERVLSNVLSTPNSLAVWGSADDAVGDVRESHLTEAGVTTIVVPNADHSLELENDIPGSIAALADVIRRVDAWLTDTVPNES